MMRTVTLTKEEQKAIASLNRLAKKWPESLQLFSWSGSLVVMKEADDESVLCSVTNIAGIPNDGGDPDDIDQYANINHEGRGNKLHAEYQLLVQQENK